jgi:hypothetical protein
MTCYKHRLTGEINVKSLLIAAAVLALSPVAAMAADQGGSWKIDANFNDMIKFSITCKLTQTGTALAGPCVGPQGEALAATGTSDGAKVVISYDTTYQGSPVHLDYKGDVQPDGSLKGIIDAGQAQGTFVGAKQ